MARAQSASRSCSLARPAASLNTGTTIDNPAADAPLSGARAPPPCSGVGPAIDASFEVADTHIIYPVSLQVARTGGPPDLALRASQSPCYANAMATTSHTPRLLRPLIDAARTRFAFMRKASTFALVGVVNTAVDFCVFMVGYKLLHLALIPANLLSWIVAVSGSYVLNSMITFAAESGRRLTLRAYVSFVASGVAGFIGNTTTLWIASFFVPVTAAKVIAIGTSFVLNFSLSHFVVFRKRTTG